MSSLLFLSPKTYAGLVDGQNVKAKLAPDFNLARCLTKEVVNLELLLKLQNKILLTCLPGVWSPWSREMLFTIEKYLNFIKSKGILPVAIISQKPNAVELFIKKSDISFPILTDETGVISKRYGVMDKFHTQPMKISKPSFFVINKRQEIEKFIIGSHAANIPNIISLMRKL